MICDTCSLIILVWLIQANVGEGIQCIPGVTCLSCDTEELILTCSEGEVVTGNVQAGFRHSFWGNFTYCGPLEEDCLAEEGYTLPQVLSCLWHAGHCGFSLDPYLTFPVLPNRCPTGMSLKAKYLVATNFECVPSMNIHTLCISGPRLLVAGNGSEVSQFLISPDFPQEYAQHVGGNVREKYCSVEIRVPQGEGIRIWSVSMDISGPDEEGVCKREHIWLSDPEGDLNDMVFCGEMNISLDWSSSGLVVGFAMEFLDPSVARTNRGFALKYHSYVLPMSPVPSQPSTQPITQPVTKSTQPLDPENNNPNPASYHSEHSMLPTLELVIILVVSLVVLVAVVTVSVILISRKCQNMDSYSPSGSVTSLSHGHV